MVVIPALGKWKQKDQDIKAILDYKQAQIQPWLNEILSQQRQQQQKINQSTSTAMSIDI